jgi:hypothetical protein
VTATPNPFNRRARLHWIGLALASSWLLCACGETSFVSLGRNTRGAALRSDAGALAADAGVMDTPPPEADAGNLPDPPFSIDEPPLCAGAVPRVSIESDCSARATVACAPASASESAIDVTLTNLLRQCGEHDSLLHVQFGEAGCAQNFELLYASQTTTRPCIAVGLEAARYACAAEEACGQGLVVAVPIN